MLSSLFPPRHFLTACPLHRLRRLAVQSTATAEATLTVAVEVAPLPLPPSATRRAHRGLSSLTVAGFELDAVSVGGQETCICLPSFRLAFDVGRCPQRLCALENVLLTHCHIDHIGGLGAYVATRSLHGQTAPNVYVPSSRLPAVEAYLAALRALEDSDSPCAVLPARVGEPLTLRGGRTVVIPFQTTHPVASNGYVLHSRRLKLKSEYTGLSGVEIARLRAAGVAVSAEVLIPEVAFTGDTAADWVNHASARDSGALRARLLIMECTFVCDAVTAEGAREFGHTHLDEICAHAELFAAAEHILLVHFSARYKRADIEAALAARLPPSLRGRVTPLLEGYA